MLCPSCPRHEVAQSWWRQYHNAQLGFVNYKQIVSDLTFDTVRSSINMVQVHEVAAGVSHTWEGKVNKSSQSAAQIFVNDASPPVQTNDIPVGGSTIPSELVKVRYKDCDTFIQVFYDKGSQLSLVNKFCSPLVINSRN